VGGDAILRLAGRALLAVGDVADRAGAAVLAGAAAPLVARRALFARFAGFGRSGGGGFAAVGGALIALSRLARGLAGVVVPAFRAVAKVLREGEIGLAEGFDDLGEVAEVGGGRVADEAVEERLGRQDLAAEAAEG